ncbi:MAG: HD domain-containing protein [Gemmatimonadales bacterium]|nr:MAG: HD domain-containing protein [Gemmatimonadales bacterium]
MPTTPHSGREFFAGLLEAFTGVLGLARGYLRSHGPRSGHLARQLGAHLGCSPAEIGRLVFGGVLADVGMIGMAEEAWEVPMPMLDARTRARVRRHPDRSQAILCAVPHLECLGPIVRHHHEWWDGTGYPDGLSGEAIPVESRILRVADTVSALQAARPHRGPLSPEDIRFAVRRATGEEFDPRVAEAFLHLADSNRLAEFDEAAFQRWILHASTTLVPPSIAPPSAGELLEILAAVVDAKDPYTAGHSRRVALLAGEMARQLGLDRELREQVWAGGYLHDVGKLGVPLRILAKPDRLDEDEMARVRDHAGMGADVLSTIPSLAHLAPAARHHHEHWDGSGYPDGLARDEIPLVARVLAVADAYDAMTTSRAYRGSLGHAHAVEEIAREAGRQFDPELARVFLTLPGTIFHALVQPVRWRPDSFLGSPGGGAVQTLLSP